MANRFGNEVPPHHIVGGHYPARIVETGPARMPGAMQPHDGQPATFVAASAQRVCDVPSGKCCGNPPAHGICPLAMQYSTAPRPENFRDSSDQGWVGDHEHTSDPTI